MKRHIAILIINIVAILLVGCIQPQKITSTAVPNPIDQLNEKDIEWITKKGGTPFGNNWVVLYPHKDDIKIENIIKLIKSSSRIEKVNRQDVETPGYRYPVDIVIRMKDGNEFTLRMAMKQTTSKVTNGTESMWTVYDDRFILKYGKGESINYYILYSKNATKYINKSSETDFPRVPVFTIKPEVFKYGDAISISGSGCTDSEVNIVLTNGNDADKEEYIIGKVKPVYGEWQWEGAINKNIKTYDGKEIFLKHEKFFIGIQFGERRIESGQQIVFTDYIFAKDKIDVDCKETVVINNCNLKNGPGNDYRDIGTLQYGDTVLLEGSYNGWYLAKTDKLNEFWIDGKNIADYNYDYNKNSFGVLTAEKVTLGNISLNKGNIIWILKRDSERSYAMPVTRDISSGYSGWIKNSDYTTNKKNIYFNQAYLKKGAKVYKEASKKSGLRIDFIDFPGDWAFIDKVEKDGWLYISVPGGRNGWVKDTDVYLP